MATGTGDRLVQGPPGVGGGNIQLTPEQMQDMLVRIDERTGNTDRRIEDLKRMLNNFSQGEGFPRCVRNTNQLQTLDERVEKLEQSNKNLFRIAFTGITGFCIWLIQELIRSFKV